MSTNDDTLSPASRQAPGRGVLLISLHFAEYAALLAAALARSVPTTLVVYHENATGELGEGYSDRVGAAGVRVVALRRPKGIGGALRNALAIWRIYRSFHPGVVHIQEASRDELALVYPCMRASRRVITIHDPEKHAGADARRFRVSRHRVFRWILRVSSDVAITHGKQLVVDLARNWQSLASRCAVVPHGPLGSHALLPAAPVAKPAASVGEGAVKRFLFFGRIEQYKGLGVFIEAIGRLRAKGLPVCGVIAGRGTDLNRYRASLQGRDEFDLRERFIPVDEVAQLFATCSAAVLPYVEGTQSGVAAMALGFGRPVVATTVGSIPELVKDGVNGLLVPPNDVAALEMALGQFLRDAELEQRLGNGALALAQGDLSWDHIARLSLDVYRGNAPFGTPARTPATT